MVFNRVLINDAAYLIRLSELGKLSHYWSDYTKQLILEEVGEWAYVRCIMFEGYWTTLMIDPFSRASDIIETCEPEKQISDNQYLSNCCLSFHNNHIKALMEKGSLKTLALQ